MPPDRPPDRPPEHRRWPMWLRDVPGPGSGAHSPSATNLSAAQLAATVDAIAEWQLPSGMVPWFPGGHADPWNHVEAAMALDLGGRRADAERAYEWLVRGQRRGGARPPYHPAAPIEQGKVHPNVFAYTAP